jgi:hypothetical protein
MNKALFAELLGFNDEARASVWSKPCDSPNHATSVYLNGRQRRARSERSGMPASGGASRQNGCRTGKCESTSIEQHARQR